MERRTTALRRERYCTTASLKSCSRWVERRAGGKDHVEVLQQAGRRVDRKQVERRAVGRGKQIARQGADET